MQCSGMWLCLKKWFGGILVVTGLLLVSLSSASAYGPDNSGRYPGQPGYNDHETALERKRDYHEEYQQRRDDEYRREQEQYMRQRQSRESDSGYGNQNSYGSDRQW